MKTGLLKNTGVVLTEEELEEAMLELDQDGDGGLDWVEFVQCKLSCGWAVCGWCGW